MSKALNIDKRKIRQDKILILSFLMPMKKIEYCYANSWA